MKERSKEGEGMMGRGKERICEGSGRVEQGARMRGEGEWMEEMVKGIKRGKRGQHNGEGKGCSLQ